MHRGQILWSGLRLIQKVNELKKSLKRPTKFENILPVVMPYIDISYALSKVE